MGFQHIGREGSHRLTGSDGLTEGRSLAVCCNHGWYARVDLKNYSKVPDDD